MAYLCLSYLMASVQLQLHPSLCGHDFHGKRQGSGPHVCLADFLDASWAKRWIPGSLDTGDINILIGELSPVT